MPRSTPPASLRPPLFLEDFSVSEDRGFLPSPDPLQKLASTFDLWEEIAAEMPKLLAASRLRSALDSLIVLDADPLQSGPELERAMLLLSYFGHGYVWGEGRPAHRIPSGIAVPWYRVAQRLGRPPVLSYASYALYNWRRLDPVGPIELGNIVLLQNFLGGVDEEWFVLVHVDIEAKAGRATAAAVRALAAVHATDSATVEQELRHLANAIDSMYGTLERMPERCDPYIYFNRVRPYIHGWKNYPAVPAGVIYEGIAEFEAKPQQLRGETGAQSSIVPALDAALGVRHANDPLREYLAEMRDYMPKEHRAFIATIEATPSIAGFVERRKDPALEAVYDDCLEGLARFRAKHLEYAARYIQQQSQRSRSNPNSVGTGGTPFMRYLKKHLTETTRRRKSGPNP